MKNKLRSVWEQGDTAVKPWLGIPTSVTAELVSKQNFDSVTVDLQHGLVDLQWRLPCFRPFRSAMRPRWREFHG